VFFTYLLFYDVSLICLLYHIKVYVKTFAKQKNGEELFYRDGYTDLRGRFDYALSSSSDIQTIEKFALFISHD